MIPSPVDTRNVLFNSERKRPSCVYRVRVKRTLTLLGEFRVRRRTFFVPNTITESNRRKRRRAMLYSIVSGRKTRFGRVHFFAHAGRRNIE